MSSASWSVSRNPANLKDAIGVYFKLIAKKPKLEESVATYKLTNAALDQSQAAMIAREGTS